MKKKRQILEDHKQSGKKFIPPLLQVGTFQTVKWQLPVLPELLWLALLNDTHGPKLGAELALALPRAAIKLVPHRWYAPASAFNVLSSGHKSAVLDFLAQEGKARLLRDALNDLVWFYPNCPLAFLFPNGAAQPQDPEAALAHFKAILAPLFYKHDKAPMMMQANAVYIAFVTGILTVASHTSLANFPEIAKYPDTEESERVGSGVRSTVIGFFGSSYDFSDWPHYFWNRGLELEPCDYGAIDDASTVQ